MIISQKVHKVLIKTAKIYQILCNHNEKQKDKYNANQRTKVTFITAITG